MTWKCLAFSDKLRPNNTPDRNSLHRSLSPIVAYIPGDNFGNLYQKLKLKFRRSKTRKTIWWHSTVYCSRISIESKISAHKMHFTSNRANQIAHQSAPKNFEYFQSTTRLPQQTWNHSYHIFHRKNDIFVILYDINFGNLTKKFQNSSDSELLILYE